MQLHSTDATLQTSAGARIKAFTIEATAKSFAILSSSLYSDKITAIIRELSCNALDSHVDAKNPGQFVIHLPNALEPYFYVEDFGTGMSQEMIENLYSTYFSSTKTERDDQIGALGLGSKSPFAYTDMFTITSVYGGEQITYSAAISDRGIPSLVFLNKKPSDKHTGVKIQFAVKSSDFEAFAEKAVYTLWRFTPRPKVVGGSSTYERLMHRFESDMVVRLQGTGWILYDTFPRWSDTARVLMGNIIYDVREVVSDPMFEKALSLLDSAFVFEMPIGSCDITPSRESISFDDLTKKNLLTRLEEIMEEMSTLLKKETNGASSLWVAAQAAKTFYSKAHMSNKRTLPFYFRDNVHHLNETIPVKCDNFACSISNRHGYRSRSRSNLSFSKLDVLKEFSITESYLIVKTTAPEFKAPASVVKGRVRLYVEAHPELTECTVVFVPENAPIDSWNNPPHCVSAKDLPKSPTTRVTKGNIEDAIFHLALNRGHSSSSIFTYAELIDSSHSFIPYVISYKQGYCLNAKALDNRMSKDSLTCLLRRFDSWYQICAAPLIVIPYMTWKKISSFPKFKSKFVLFPEALNRTIDEKLLPALQDVSALNNNKIAEDYYELLMRYFGNTKEYHELPETSLFKISMEALKQKKAENRQPTASSQELRTLLAFYYELLNIGGSFSVKVPELLKEDPYKFFERYPMLTTIYSNDGGHYRYNGSSFLRGSPFGSSDSEADKISINKEVFLYINMMEQFATTKE